MPTYAEFAQPPWNSPASVEEAMGRVLTADSKAAALSAHEGILNAVGNNHAGTYYSVALPVVAELCRTLSRSNPWAQFAAIEALLDLAGSFEPESGNDLLNSPEGNPAVPLRPALLEQVASSAQTLAAIAAGSGPAAASARSLLEVLE